MILVDTSVWIATFSRVDPLDLEAHVAREDIATCLPVVQEVLQGFRDARAQSVARGAMLALPMVENPVTEALVLEAVDLYRAARRRGFTIRSSVDCLIAAAALRHDVEVLHRDRDYTSLSRLSALRERRI